LDQVGKCFSIYAKPRDRLKAMVFRPITQLFNIDRPPYAREFWALAPCSIRVQKGEVVGIIGRNGSGKSTLLQLICGTLTPTAGTVQTYGRVAALLELGSGFNQEFTGKENVYLNASLLGLSRAEVDERYEAIVDFAQIGPFIDQPVKTYSSGMMVRLAFSVIAHVDADILVIDEALAVGDAFFTQKCMRFIRQFITNGTVLLVSHDTSAVKALCDRAIWLNDGALCADGDPKSVSQQYLEAAFEQHTDAASAVEQGPRTPSLAPAQPSTYQTDQRDQFINYSNLRNDLQIFSFDASADAHVSGAATITDVRFTAENGRPLAWIVGGEIVVLEVSATAHAAITSPIIGFYVKDRLGQEIFGDNTYLSYADAPLHVESQRSVRASFRFQMPRLAPGDYAVTVALAEGDQLAHQQHHWIHDALTFRSQTSSVASGIVGIPMAEIRMESVGSHE
jgi:lipopolysaccharide transport system ATP-binding protein